MSLITSCANFYDIYIFSCFKTATFSISSYILGYSSIIYDSKIYLESIRRSVFSWAMTENKRGIFLINSISPKYDPLITSKNPIFYS
jgi:hypothetical protein